MLLQGGKRIYSAVSKDPRHTLPLRWRFDGERYRLNRGTYRWVVVPLLGDPAAPREGKAVVDASYTF